MVRCSGTNIKGYRCGKYGDPNDGPLFYCRHHFKCRGFKDEELQIRCGSRANPKYDGYCGAAHHPDYNFFRPIQFREDNLPVNVNELLKTYKFKDAYTDAALEARRAQRDHVIECQVPSHVFNKLQKEYINRGHDVDQLTNAIPIVKEFINDKNNLVPIDQDINLLKGAGVTFFLNERIFFDKKALWTTSLTNAHKQINSGKIQAMMTKRLSRETTKAVGKIMTKGLKRMARKLEGEYDSGTEEELAERFRDLHVQIKKT